jgi:hypothetical protein
MTPITPPDPGAQPIPTIAFRNEDAHEWYEVYSALTRHAVADPATGDLPENRAARDIAYRRFNAAFEVL